MAAGSPVEIRKDLGILGQVDVMSKSTNFYSSFVLTLAKEYQATRPYELAVPTILPRSSVRCTRETSAADPGR